MQLQAGRTQRPNRCRPDSSWPEERASSEEWHAVVGSLRKLIRGRRGILSDRLDACGAPSDQETTWSSNHLAPWAHHLPSLALTVAVGSVQVAIQAVGLVIQSRFLP